MGEGNSVRYTNAVLYDDNLNKHVGDFLLNPDGSWRLSKGDEDVLKTIDGRTDCSHVAFKTGTHLSNATECKRFF